MAIQPSQQSTASITIHHTAKHRRRRVPPGPFCSLVRQRTQNSEECNGGEQRRSPGGVRLRQDHRRLRQRQLGRRRPRRHPPLRRTPPPPPLEPRHRRDDGGAARGGKGGGGHPREPPRGAAVPARRRGRQGRPRARLRAAGPQRRQRLLHRHRPRAPWPRCLLLRHRHQPRAPRRRWPPHHPPLPRLRRRRRRRWTRLRPPHLPAQHVQGQGDGEDTPPRRSGGGGSLAAAEGRGVPRRRPGRLLPVPEAARGGLRDAAGRAPRLRPHRGLAAGRRRALVGRLRGPRQGASRHRQRRDRPRRRHGARRCRWRRRRAGGLLPHGAAAGASGGFHPPAGGRPRAQLTHPSGAVGRCTVSAK